MKEEVNATIMASLKYLLHQRRAARKIIAAFRHWRKMTKPSFTWNSVMMDDSSCNSIIKRLTSIKRKKQVSARSLQLASESYKHMFENCELGDIIIVEQC